MRALLTTAVALALLVPAWSASPLKAQDTTSLESTAAAPIDVPAPSPEEAETPESTAATPGLSSEPAEAPTAPREPAAPEPTPAETGPVVLLLAPSELRAEWTAALQIELAPRGITVVPMDPPDGPTPLIVDAETQRLVLEHNADSAVLVVAGVRAHSIRVLTPDATSARVAPVSVEADPRTAALIAVSLSDEHPLPAAPSEQETPWYRRGAPAPPRVVDFESPIPAPPEHRGEHAIMSFRVGTGAFGYLNDRRAFVGSLARVGGGLAYGHFEAEVLVEGGLMLDQLSGHGSEAQPMVRGCLGMGGVTDDTTQLHLGLQACAGYAEARTLQRDSFFDRGLGFDPGFVFETGGVLLDLAAYVAVSFPAGDGLQLQFRANLGGGFMEAVNDAPRVSATLSTVLAVM